MGPIDYKWTILPGFTLTIDADFEDLNYF